MALVVVASPPPAAASSCIARRALLLPVSAENSACSLVSSRPGLQGRTREKPIACGKDLNCCSQSYFYIMRIFPQIPCSALVDVDRVSIGYLAILSEEGGWSDLAVDPAAAGPPRGNLAGSPCSLLRLNTYCPVFTTPCRRSVLVLTVQEGR